MGLPPVCHVILEGLILDAGNSKYGLAIGSGAHHIRLQRCTTPIAALHVFLHDGPTNNMGVGRVLPSFPPAS